jgi:hypothetical protein
MQGLSYASVNNSVLLAQQECHTQSTHAAAHHAYMRARSWLHVLDDHVNRPPDLHFITLILIKGSQPGSLGGDAGHRPPGCSCNARNVCVPVCLHVFVSQQIV